MSEQHNTNISNDWWSDTPHKRRRGEDSEESLLDPRWNRSFKNISDMSEEEVTKTLQRTKKSSEAVGKIETARRVRHGKNQE